MFKKMSALILDPDQDVLNNPSATYDLFIVVLTLFSLAVVVVLLVVPITPATSAILMRVDFALTLLFLADVGVILWRRRNRTAYLIRRMGWLDILGCVPAIPGMPLTALFRFARLARLARVVNDLRSRERGQVLAEAREVPARTVLLSTIAIGIMLVTVASLFVLRLEKEAPGASIRTGADAIWWALVTITTVGYGDYVPVTFLGRVLALVLMTFGIGIFAVLTSYAGTRLVGLSHDQQALVKLVREENAAIRAELAEVKALLEQSEAVEKGEA
jgi:voltage-gated potassium channel